MGPLLRSVALLSLAAPALSQGLNVDLGPNLILAPVPSAGYGAASGQSGVWNGVPPSLTPVPLVDLGGGPTGVTLVSDSSSSATLFPSVIPAGDDQALMEDFQITPSLNTLVTWTLNGLFDGPYTLFVYASDPSNGGVQVVLDVPGSTAGPQTVGGGWPGMHAPNDTYGVFTVGVIGGTLEFTAEVLGGPLDSGVVNGFQLIPITIPPLGFNYCGSNPNSTGQTAYLTGAGSASVSANALTLEAGGLPPSTFGLFLASLDQAQVPFAGGSQGVLCLGGSIGRFNAIIGQASPSGILTICTQGCPLSQTFSLAAIPQGGGLVAIQPGDTWSFQAWFRDTTSAGGLTSNFTDGYQVTFQ